MGKSVSMQFLNALTTFKMKNREKWLTFSDKVFHDSMQNLKIRMPWDDVTMLPNTSLIPLYDAIQVQLPLLGHTGTRDR